MSVTDVESCELLALSTIHQPWSLYLPIDADPDSIANVWRSMDEVIGHLTPISGPTPLHRLSTFVVEWHGDIALRRGVGQVHSEAWEPAGPVPKAIKLG